MGRPLCIPWTESADELFRLWRQEKNLHFRDRLYALWLLRRGQALPQVTHALGRSYRTLQRWLNWYRHGGLAELRYHCPKGKGRPPLLSPAQQHQLYTATRQGQFRRAKDAVQWVEEQWGIRYSENGMWRLLRRLQLRRKVPRPYSPRREEAAQSQWKKGGYEP